MSWAETMFQKLDDLCLEVDVAVWEEMRNVENHLQTIGANVVNFYRDMVLDEPAQSSEDVAVEEAANDGIDILVSDASKLRIDEVHHGDETKKEVAHDVDYFVTSTSEMDTDEDHCKEDTKEEAGETSEMVTDEDYPEEDAEVQADDASDVLTGEDYKEEETDDASEIDAGEYEDIDVETYETSEIETYKYNSEEDEREEAVYRFDDLVSDASKTFCNKGCRKVLLDFHKLIHSASVEPTDEAQYDLSLPLNVDHGVHEKTKMIVEENLATKMRDSNIFVVTDTNNQFESCESQGLDVEFGPGNASTTMSPYESIAEAILDNDQTELDKETIYSFESMKLEENRDMTDKAEFEITGREEEEKTIELFGVTVEITDDEFCDSEWVIV